MTVSFAIKVSDESTELECLRLELALGEMQTRSFQTLQHENVTTRDHLMSLAGISSLSLGLSGMGRQDYYLCTAF